MSDTPALAIKRPFETHVAMILARLIVGGVFVWLSIGKIQQPATFLKLIREYQLLPEQPAYAMNLTAIILPWVELLCGLLMVFGYWLRGASLMIFGLLVFFTGAVAYRAIGIYNDGGIAFCDIKFDCGCGGGEIPICDKLRENTALTGLAFIALVSNSRWLSIEALKAKRRDPA